MIRGPINAQTETRRVAIYCRVSTDKQACKEDSSLDTQKDRLVRYVEDKQKAGHKWELAYEFIEGEDRDGRRKGKSGKDLMRPGFAKLMEKVQRRLVDVVLFTKIDRISRSVIDFLTLVEEFERHGVDLVSLKEEINTASASGRVMTTIMIALAQFEREQTSERTKEKMLWRAGKGLPIGPPPLGYRMHEKRFQVVPEEAEAVRFIEEAYLKTRSLNKVVKMVHERGIRTRRGGTLTKHSVSHVLNNPLYTGWICLNGQRNKGQHEALREEETQRRIRELLERNHVRNGNGVSKAKQYEYLLQGLVVCGYCRGRMVPRTSFGRSGNPYHYYICARADRTVGIDCSQNFLNAVEADQHVLDYARDLALRDDLVRRLCQERDADFAKALAVLRDDRERVKPRLTENRRQATNLVKLMARMGEEPGEAMLTQCRDLEREGKELEASLERMGGEIAKLEATEIQADRAGRTVRYLSGILEHKEATAAQLRDILPKFVNYVVWRRDPATRKGRFEVAFFERPFRADRGRLLREVVEDLGGPGGPGKGSGESSPTGDANGNGKGPPGGRTGGECGSPGPGLSAGYDLGSLPGPAFNRGVPPEWTLPIEEVDERPPSIILTDKHFQIYQNGRRTFISGERPPGLEGAGPPTARAWRAYRNLMAREPAWDRAERYRRLMAEGGHASVRALAEAVGEDFSKITRVLQILELPPEVLEALRRHAGNPAVKAHFTIKRLRQLATGCRKEEVLRLVEDVAGAAPISK